MANAPFSSVYILCLGPETHWPKCYLSPSRAPGPMWPSYPNYGPWNFFTISPSILFQGPDTHVSILPEFLGPKTSLQYLLVSYSRARTPTWPSCPSLWCLSLGALNLFYNFSYWSVPGPGQPRDHPAWICVPWKFVTISHSVLFQGPDIHLTSCPSLWCQSLWALNIFYNFSYCPIQGPRTPTWPSCLSLWALKLLNIFSNWSVPGPGHPCDHPARVCGAGGQAGWLCQRLPQVLRGHQGGSCPSSSKNFSVSQN